MTKTGRNDKCPCDSGKKYKACCLKNDDNKKREQDELYINGQENNSNKINFCLEHYKTIFDKHKIINITDLATEENIKHFYMKNLTTKTIMLLEKTDKNKEMFTGNSKDVNVDNFDLMVLYKGGYRELESLYLVRYDDSIIDFINNQDIGKFS